MNLGFIIPPASEIYAWLCIIAMLGAALAWLLKVQCDRRYLSKRAYYAHRDDDAAVAEKAELEKKELARTAADSDTKFREKVIEELKSVKEHVAKLDREQQHAAGPIEALTKTFSEMAKEFRDWRLDMEKRVSVVEDRQKRGGGRRCGGR